MTDKKQAKSEKTVNNFNPSTVTREVDRQFGLGSPAMPPLDAEIDRCTKHYHMV